MSERKPLIDRTGEEILWWDQRDDFRKFTVKLSNSLSIATGRTKKTQDELAELVGTTRTRLTKLLNVKELKKNGEPADNFIKIPAYAVYKYHEITGMSYDELFGETAPESGSKKEELLRRVKELSEKDAGTLLTILKGMKELK